MRRWVIVTKKVGCTLLPLSIIFNLDMYQVSTHLVHNMENLVFHNKEVVFLNQTEN